MYTYTYIFTYIYIYRISGTFKHFKSFLWQNKNNVNKIILWCKVICISFFIRFFSVHKGTMLSRDVLLDNFRQMMLFIVAWDGAKCFLLPKGVLS